MQVGLGAWRGDPLFLGEPWEGAPIWNKLLTWEAKHLAGAPIPLETDHLWAESRAAASQAPGFLLRTSTWIIVLPFPWLHRVRVWIPSARQPQGPTRHAEPALGQLGRRRQVLFKWCVCLVTGGVAENGVFRVRSVGMKGRKYP